MSPSAIHLATHLAMHNETFPKIPPSPPLRREVPRVVADPKLKWEMVGKIIDLKIQSLNELSVAGSLRQVMSPQVEFCPRQYAAASRELKRAVERYLALLESGL
jgi:hypothetical protein